MYNRGKVNFNLDFMKKIFVQIFASLLLFFSFVGVSTSIYAGIFDDDDPVVPYCKDDECWLDEGIELVKEGINDMETERPFSQYVQDIIIYLLTFISIIGVIYIIYAWFQLMIGWAWDDSEKMKKTKNIILYVLAGIVLMWLAYSIMIFIIDVLNASGGNNLNTNP